MERNTTCIAVALSLIVAGAIVQAHDLAEPDGRYVADSTIDEGADSTIDEGNGHGTATPEFGMWGDEYLFHNVYGDKD